MSDFIFKPHQRVLVKGLDCPARVLRCIDEGGLQYLYLVDFTTNGEPKNREFFEDEIEATHE